MGSAMAPSSEDNSNSSVIHERAGIIPRTCHDLFQQIEDKCDGNAEVELSYLEIYNECLHDLLSNDNIDENLRIRETLQGEVFVEGLTSRPVASPLAIGDLMKKGSSRRTVASTSVNEFSSRSHAICVLRIKGLIEAKDGTTSDKFTSKLTLVDLAGSERIKKTGGQGERQKEDIHINKSLFALGQVVAALAENRKPPYRDSKLTRLLQDSLGGNSRTIMLACTSPAHCNIEESINTLRYATSARSIKNTVQQNIEQNVSHEEAAKLQKKKEMEDLLRSAQSANQRLQQQVEDLQKKLQLERKMQKSQVNEIQLSLAHLFSDLPKSSEDRLFETKKHRNIFSWIFPCLGGLKR